MCFIHSNPNFRFLEHRTIGGIWLIGEMKEIEISERTFGILWHLLTIAVRFDRDDMVMLYWSNAHQHFIYYLQSVHEDREYIDGKSLTKNQEAVDKRDGERESFLEFNFALGGLLLFKNRLPAIKRMFTYTSSTPPSYDLLPLHMTQVFRLFFKFWDVYQQHFPFITQRYWYPDTEGIGSEDLVKIWTCKYAAVLLLRQYSIVKYYTYIEPLQPPQLPAKKSERRLWIDHLDHFKRLVTEQYENKELLAALGLSFLTEKWLRDQKKTAPVEFVQQVKDSVTKVYERTEVEQEMSPAEVTKIKETSARIIKNAFDGYGNLFDKKIIRNFSGFQSLGIRAIMDKSDFVDDKEADSSNHHSINAGSVADNLHDLVSYTFSMQPVVSYQVSEDDLFLAIDRLNADPKEYVLVNLGYDLSYWIASKRYAGLTESEYKGIPLYSFSHHGAGRRIYVVRVDQLPYLFTRKPHLKEIKKYTLEWIGEPNVYFSILDLYRNKAVREEWLKSTEISDDDKKDIEKKVQIYIIAQAIIRWKKGTKLIAISIRYSYMPGAEAIQSLDDISPIGAPV